MNTAHLVYLERQELQRTDVRRYGMLISVLRGEQPEFDGLLRFYQSFINPDHGMMMWQILDKLTPSDRNSATDGDMDVAYALFKAG